MYVVNIFVHSDRVARYTENKFEWINQMGVYISSHSTLKIMLSVEFQVGRFDSSLILMSEYVYSIYSKHVFTTRF